MSGSADSEDSPSKDSGLSPAAKELATPTPDNKISPAKQGGLAHAVFGNGPPAMPGQQVQGMVLAIPGA